MFALREWRARYLFPLLTFLAFGLFYFYKIRVYADYYFAMRRFVPVVRHFISIPAGIGKTPMVPFLVVTFIGSTIWNTFLLVCGMKLREHWPVVQKYSHQVDIGIVALILIGMVWWVKVRWPQFRPEKPSSGS